MGNQTDQATGLDDFNAREYNPATGSFLSQDPVAAKPVDPQTLDRYAYAAGEGWRGVGALAALCVALGAAAVLVAAEVVDAAAAMPRRRRPQLDSRVVVWPLAVYASCRPRRL